MSQRVRPSRRLAGLRHLAASAPSGGIACAGDVCLNELSNDVKSLIFQARLFTERESHHLRHA